MPVLIKKKLSSMSYKVDQGGKKASKQAPPPHAHVHANMQNKNLIV